MLNFSYRTTRRLVNIEQNLIVYRCVDIVIDWDMSFRLWILSVIGSTSTQGVHPGWDLGSAWLLSVGFSGGGILLIVRVRRKVRRSRDNITYKLTALPNQSRADEMQELRRQSPADNVV